MKEKGRRLLEIGRDKIRNERVWGLIWLKHIIYLKESILSKLIAIHNIPIKKNLTLENTMIITDTEYGPRLKQVIVYFMNTL